MPRFLLSHAASLRKYSVCESPAGFLPLGCGSSLAVNTAFWARKFQIITSMIWQPCPFKMEFDAGFPQRHSPKFRAQAIPTVTYQCASCFPQVHQGGPGFPGVPGASTAHPTSSSRVAGSEAIAGPSGQREHDWEASEFY